MLCGVLVCGRFGLWPLRFVAASVCGRFDLWPFRCVAVPVCGRSSLWPIRFVAVSVCGRSGLWPFRLWPIRFVAVMTCYLVYWTRLYWGSKEEALISVTVIVLYIFFPLASAEYPMKCAHNKFLVFCCGYIMISRGLFGFTYLYPSECYFTGNGIMIWVKWCLCNTTTKHNKVHVRHFGDMQYLRINNILPMLYCIHRNGM